MDLFWYFFITWVIIIINTKGIMKRIEAIWNLIYERQNSKLHNNLDDKDD